MPVVKVGTPARCSGGQCLAEDFVLKGDPITDNKNSARVGPPTSLRIEPDILFMRISSLGRSEDSMKCS